MHTSHRHVRGRLPHRPAQPGRHEEGRDRESPAQSFGHLRTPRPPRRAPAAAGGHGDDHHEHGQSDRRAARQGRSFRRPRGQQLPGKDHPAAQPRRPQGDPGAGVAVAPTPRATARHRRRTPGTSPRSRSRRKRVGATAASTAERTATTAIADTGGRHQPRAAGPRPVPPPPETRPAPAPARRSLPRRPGGDGEPLEVDEAAGRVRRPRARARSVRRAPRGPPARTRRPPGRPRAERTRPGDQEQTRLRPPSRPGALRRPRRRAPGPTAAVTATRAQRCRPPAAGGSGCRVPRDREGGRRCEGRRRRGAVRGEPSEREDTEQRSRQQQGDGHRAFRRWVGAGGEPARRARRALRQP